MKYRQLLLLITAIWAGQVAVPYAFENVIPKKIEYRTYYMRKHDGQFKAADMEVELGDKGWVLVNVIPDQSDPDTVICFLKRQSILKLDR